MSEKNQTLLIQLIGGVIVIGVFVGVTLSPIRESPVAVGLIMAAVSGLWQRLGFAPLDSVLVRSVATLPEAKRDSLIMRQLQSLHPTKRTELLARSLPPPPHVTIVDAGALTDPAPPPDVH